MDSKPMNARSDAPARADEPGKGDDVACAKCGAVALDTGLECSECGHDNHEAVTGKPFGSAALAQPAAPVAQPCGHPAALLVRSVESNHMTCELCEALNRRDDAEMSESELIKERDALRALKVVTSSTTGLDLDEVERLLVECGNASFAAGDWRDDDDDSPESYKELCRKSDAARASLLDYLRQFARRDGEEG